MDRMREGIFWPVPPAGLLRGGQSCVIISPELSSLPGPFRPMWGHEKPASAQRVVPPVGYVVQDLVRHIIVVFNVM